MKRLFRSMAIYICAIIAVVADTVPVYAKETNNYDSSLRLINVLERHFVERPTVGETFINAAGEHERIVKVEMDGSFTTEVIGDETQSISNMSCTHPAAKLQALAESVELKMVKNATVCYKSRTKIKNRCRACNKTVYTYGPWKNNKHKYLLFRKTCSICGYVKK